MYIEGDVPYVTGNNNGNNGGWNDWSWIIGLAIIGALFGGFGGNGFGGGRGGNCATQADIASGFANNSILSNQNDAILANAQGFASVQQTLCQGFSGVNATVTNGFANLNTNLASLAYNTAGQISGLSRELADCCCTTQRNIDSLRYDMSKGFCEVVRAGQDNTRAILDYLTGEKIAGLQAENAGLKAQISNDRQSAYLLSELKPCPSAAYIVPNPNCCYNYNVTGFGYDSRNNGCGCC